MSEYYWNPATTSSLPVSNEDSNSKSFQRTISAQVNSVRIVSTAECSQPFITPTEFFVSILNNELKLNILDNS